MSFVSCAIVCVMSDPDILDEPEYTTRELELLVTIKALKEENDKLRNLMEERVSEKTCELRVHYMYAAPLVLVDSLGSTVIETMDPIRADREHVGLGVSMHSISVLSTGAISRLRYVLEQDQVSVLHISMHTVDLASAGGGRTVRCAIEDDSGRGYLLSPEEFATSLGSIEGSVKLLFVNACKSIEVARAIINLSPGISFAICSGDQEPVLETSAQIFSQELYAALESRVDIASAFERAKIAIRANSSVKVSSQADLFKLIISPLEPLSSSSFSPCPGASLPPTSFWVGHVAPELASFPEDFIGREIDIVRFCRVVFGGASRRIFSVSGLEGVGKSTFLGEACKYYASPGGRTLIGGICLVQLPPLVNEDKAEDIFLSALVEALKDTVSSFRSWHRTLSQVPALEEISEDPSSASRQRIDSGNDEFLTTASSSLKSYKVFWAETFQSESELSSFLDSYQLALPEESVSRLYTELRLNGTQLQDWGSDRLIRVVHVVRLLIRGEHGKYLLENRGGQLRMLSKKFDPVTENVLEVSSTAVRKELGSEIDGKLIGISRLVLRDRKPLVEINRTSPSYPGLATKYVLYTADVALTNLPLERSKFTTVENQHEKFHSWEWSSPDSTDLISLLPPNDVLLVKKALEAQVTVEGTVITLLEKPLLTEFTRLISEWASLCDQYHRRHHPGKIASGLALLNAEDYFNSNNVRQLIGNALIRHPGLKVLFTQECAYSKPIMNLATSAVSYKVVQFPLGPLQPIDAAILFTRRIHRPLFHRDWWVDVDAPPPPFGTAGSRETITLIEEIDEEVPLVMNPKSSRGLANLAKLARHPVLVATEGIPLRIIKIAQHVTSELQSINELANMRNRIFTDF